MTNATHTQSLTALGFTPTEVDLVRARLARAEHLNHELTQSLNTACDELQRAHDELKVLRKAKARAEADALTLLDVAADRVAR